MKKILITGASGFLGRYLLNFAPKEVLILAQHHKHHLPNTSPNVQPFKLDFTKLSLEQIDDFKPQVIIHAAAQSSIDACELDPEIAWELNFEVTRRLTDIADRNRSRLIFTSSDTVFDGKQGNYSEGDPPNPLNVYAETKIKSEQYILENLRDAVVVRPALFYGLSLNGNPSFSQVMLENLKAGKRLYLFTDQYRSPLPVSLLAQALWELVDSGFGGILHLGGTERISRYDMGKLLCRQFSLPLDLIIPISSEQSSQVAARPRDCSLNVTLASSLLKTKLVDCAYGLKLAFR